MIITRGETLPITCEADIVAMRQQARKWAIAANLSLVDQTKWVTAASELGRNALIHGGGGEVTIQSLSANERVGVRMIFKDKGRGIPDIELALRDGFTTGSGLGLGLGGSKRLVNEFEIESRPNEGTTISITRWK